jgi:hypothetical protein
MSRRKRLARAFTAAALGLGLAAPAAQAHPLGIPIPELMKLHNSQVQTPDHRFQTTPVTGVTAVPARAAVVVRHDDSVDWTAVGVATGISLLIGGGLGATGYRLRFGRPATA